MVSNHDDQSGMNISTASGLNSAMIVADAAPDATAPMPSRLTSRVSNRPPFLLLSLFSFEPLRLYPLQEVGLLVVKGSRGRCQEGDA